MFKNVHNWLGSYVAGKLGRLANGRKTSGPVHVMFCVCDHFEPDWNNAGPAIQAGRVRAWVERYPQIASGHRDTDGYLPQHTFFYPAEVYVPEHLMDLAALCRDGYGEVEVHLHHDRDTPLSLREKLEKAREDFARHGLLGKDRQTGEIRYAFIHGNWALNNSRPDGRFCGVNEESAVLRETGCYADFTYPSAPSSTQPGKINALYYDDERDARPCSHHTGCDVSAGEAVDGKLMLVQGPLTLNWRRRKWGVFPRIENSDITGTNPPTADRVDLWIDQRIAVRGRPEWIFVKVHTHGAVEANSEAWLGELVAGMLEYLEKNYNDGQNFFLHYVTAREVYNIIKAAEAGERGDPGDYRDYKVIKNARNEK